MAPVKKAALPEDSRTRTIYRILLAAGLVVLSYFVVQDFLAPIGWAIIIAVTTWPLYVRFAGLFSKRRESAVAAFVFTLLAGALLLLPVGLALHRAAQEMRAIEETVTQYRETGVPMPEWLPRVPAVGEPAARWWRGNLSDPKSAAEWLGAADPKENAATGRALGAQVLHRTFLFIVSLIALYEILRHGPWIANRFLETADRLLGEPGERLASKMVDAIRGTVFGTVIVALIEGTLIGAAYFVAGVSNPLLLGILTAAFAMLPLGAWLVFTAASLLLIAQGGSGLAAAAVFGFGAVVMIAGDTFLWPTLVGNAARLPFLLALIGIFGGVQFFGLLGLFAGPVVMAALLVVWREWLMRTEA
jgi:predicted PurR-regulated permease PerM